MEMPRTHYDNLKVQIGASADEIRKAYKRLAAKHHPDRNGNAPLFTKRMQLINEAYEVLSNTASRAEHDRWVARERSLVRAHARAQVEQRERERQQQQKRAAEAEAAKREILRKREQERARQRELEMERQREREQEKKIQNELLRQLAHQRRIKEQIERARTAFLAKEKASPWSSKMARKIYRSAHPSRRVMSAEDMYKYYVAHAVLPPVCIEPSKQVEQAIFYVACLLFGFIVSSLF